MAKTKRARGGAFGGKTFADTNGTNEGGMPRKIDPAAKASRLATKSTSDGFARGGAMKGRASGGKMDEDGLVRTPGHSEDKGRARGGATRKEGGAISGAASAPRADRRARGGRTSAPFSAATHTTEREGSGKSGHEGE